MGRLRAFAPVRGRGSAPMLIGETREQRGQALPEFALVLPILAILLFGVIQLGVIFGGYNALINSVREAARYGSVCVGSAATCGPNTASYAGTKIAQSGFAYASAPWGQIQYQSYQDATGTWNVRMQVTACVNSVLFIPLIGNIIHPANPSVFPMKSVETFRVEGNPSNTQSSDPNVAASPSWGPAYTFGTQTCS